MEKRYQVFVSSTYEDLQKERQEVMQALLELDCIPSGMELFPAADEDQWTLIKNVIDDCDYYILIVGGRYGSLGPDGISYTEMEYKYALEQNKPIISFLHKKPGEIQAKKTEKTKEGKDKLNSFRELVKKKMVKYWETPVELGSVVSRSVIRLIKTSPGIGWVRADVIPDESTTKDVLKLKNKIEELENQLEEVRTRAPKGTENLAKGTDEFIINYSYLVGNYRYKSDNLKNNFKTTWNDIFSCISPSMINEAKEIDIKNALNVYIKESQESKLNKEHKNKEIFEYNINESDFQTIKIQLRALGLIKKSVKQRSVKDTSTYWTLTPYGDNVMTQLRAIKKDGDIA